MEAGTNIQGGQTVVNPWLLIGGVATSVCSMDEMIVLASLARDAISLTCRCSPHHAQPGDLLVLTKPLGTQVAVNAFQWMTDGLPRYDKIRGLVTPADIDRLFEKATGQMATLNRRAASLLRKYGAHACTDVTGFGLLGHATNLVETQIAPVDFLIDRLPCLRFSAEIDAALAGAMKLRRGFSPETSGGLFAAIPSDKADAFVAEMRAEEGFCAWIVGTVTPGTRQARIADDAHIIDY